MGEQVTDRQAREPAKDAPKTRGECDHCCGALDGHERHCPASCDAAHPDRADTFCERDSRHEGLCRYGRSYWPAPEQPAGEALTAEAVVFDVRALGDAAADAYAERVSSESNAPDAWRMALADSVAPPSATCVRARKQCAPRHQSPRPRAREAAMARMVPVHPDYLAQLTAEHKARGERIAELERERDTPHTANFLEAVQLEALHQRERWGAEHDAGKEPQDWFWLLGYLGGKALWSAVHGDREKALHHTISSAAVLLNWHAALSGEDNRMRPGIEAPEVNRG